MRHIGAARAQCHVLEAQHARKAPPTAMRRVGRCDTTTIREHAAREYEEDVGGGHGLDEVVELYASAGCASWPVLANKRNGAWYRDAFDGACYFIEYYLRNDQFKLVIAVVIVLVVLILQTGSVWIAVMVRAPTRIATHRPTPIRKSVSTPSCIPRSTTKVKHRPASWTPP